MARADEEELGEGVADQQVLFHHQVGVLAGELPLLGEDLHQAAGEEVEPTAVVDQSKQIGEAGHVGGDTRLLIDPIVGPADALCGSHLPELLQVCYLAELLLILLVDEGDSQAFEAAKQRHGHGQQGRLQGAGGPHPEDIDLFALPQLLLQGELVQIDIDLLYPKRLAGVAQGEIQQLELVVAVQLVDGAFGDLDHKILRLRQQGQAQTQGDEPFHCLHS